MQISNKKGYYFKDAEHEVKNKTNLGIKNALNIQ